MQSRARAREALKSNGEGETGGRAGYIHNDNREGKRFFSLSHSLRRVRARARLLQRSLRTACTEAAVRANSGKSEIFALEEEEPLSRCRRPPVEN